MTSLDVVGVNGGDICDWDCDLSECDRLDDCRLCLWVPTRDLFGDF